MRQVVVAAIVAGLVAFGVGRYVAPMGGTAGAAKETAYERVVRTGVLRCGYFVWPPYMQRDPNTGELSGIFRDLTDNLAAKLGLKVEWAHELVIGNRVADIQASKIDAVCGDVMTDETAAKHVDYTQGFFGSAIHAYARQDDLRFDGGKERINRPDVTVAVLDGDITVTMAQQDFPAAKVHALPQTADPSQLMLDVAQRRADVVFMDPPSIDAFNRSHPDAMLRRVPYGRPLRVYGINFSVPKDGMAGMMDAAIEAMVNFGDVDAILAKYDPDGTLFYRPRMAFEVK